MTEWRTIVSAPTDGSWILMWRSHGVKPLIARWDKQYGAYELDNGDFVYHLTHWMPLPGCPADIP
ncbi:MAG: hypothetical protein DDT26_00015 [Dehalococcoidia bacterium]|nr:hypothetical protein [Chloroflexota bacterium]